MILLSMKIRCIRLIRVLLNTMKKLVDIVDKILITFLMILMVSMVLDVSWGVFTRYVAPKPSPFTEELAAFLMMWVGLLGGAYALRQKAHLGIDILTSKLSPQYQHRWDIFIYVMIILFAAFVLIWGGIRLVSIQLYLQQTSAALQIKVGYVYLVLPITGLLLTFYSIHFILEAVKGARAATSSSERAGGHNA